MCGILGLVSKKKKVNQHDFANALDKMQHRGPDAQKVWINPDSRTALGHARLSIIDLESGYQPLSNEDNTIHAIVNGEFYDFERIRADLMARGHKFKTGSDSEILIHLYEEYGFKCMTHLRGEFSFVLWDQSNQMIFSARDRFGIKPLFYSEDDNGFYLASEVKSILALGVQPAWDQEVFHNQLYNWAPGPGRTIFKNVYQVPPGHCLIYAGGNRVIKKYWDFDFSEQKDSPKSEGEWVEKFRASLEESVRLRLRADVPIAMYLSGGLDSSTILGMMSKYAKKSIDAFTISIDDPSYDEKDVAIETAKKFGATIHPILFDGRVMADNFDKTVWHSETIIYNGHSVGKYLLSKTAKKAGFKVVMTGEGSDDILGGYSHFRRDLLLEAIQKGSDRAAAAEALDRLRETNLVSKNLIPTTLEETIPTLKKAIGFVPSVLEARSLFAKRYHEFLNDDYIAENRIRDEHHCFLAEIDLSPIENTNFLNRSMFMWSKGILPNYILAVGGDRTEMANSIEARLPFLDHHVVELASSMPTTLKIKDGVEKYILREAAKPFITETVYKRQKHPFKTPPALSKDDFFNVYIQDVLRSSNVDNVPFLDRKKIGLFLDKLLKDESNLRTTFDAVIISAACATRLNELYKMS